MRTVAKGLLAIVVVLWAAQSRADTKEFDKQMESVVDVYLKIHELLADDKFKGVPELARAVAEKARRLNPKAVKGKHAAHYAKLPDKIVKSAKDMEGAKGLKGIRAVFKELSKPFAMWATMSQPQKIYVIYCPMAKGSWLQRDREIRNPYHGHEMLECGEIVYDPDKKK